MNNLEYSITSKSNTVLLLFYTLLLAYGTLFPLSNWQRPHPDWLDMAIHWQLLEVSKTDILTNLFVYIPLGYLLVKRFTRSAKQFTALSLAVLAGAFLSLCLELVQAFLPSRVTSTLDLVLNTVGALTGGWLAFFVNRHSQKASPHIISQHFLAGAHGHAALTIIGFWFLSHLIPLAPSLDWGLIKDSIKPIITVVKAPESFNYLRMFEELFYFTSIAALLLSSMRNKRNAILFYIYSCIAILAGKIIIIYRALSLEGILGCAVSVILALAIIRTNRNTHLLISLLSIATAILIDRLIPIAHAQTHPFSWIPFLSHMRDLNGFIDILHSIWPYMALSYFFLSSNAATMMAGRILYVLFIMGVTISLEIAQLYIPGRYPDITDILLAMIGTLLIFSILPKISASKYIEEKSARKTIYAR